MNGQDRKLISKFQSDVFYQMAEIRTIMEERWKAHDTRSEEKWDMLNDKIGDIKENHIRHLDRRITGLYFTVIGSFLLMIATYLMRCLIGGG